MRCVAPLLAVLVLWTWTGTGCVRAGFDRDRDGQDAGLDGITIIDSNGPTEMIVADSRSDTITIADAPKLPDLGQAHLIFATSTLLQGNLGGITGADGLCLKSAISAGLSGTFKALISDTFTSAKDRLTISYPVYNMAGQLIAADTADLWDGELQNPIAYDEHGVLIASAFKVWNGTRDSGRTYAQNNCKDWTSSAHDDIGEVGMLNKKATWIDDQAITCNKEGRLYCISQ